VWLIVTKNNDKGSNDIFIVFLAMR